MYCLFSYRARENIRLLTACGLHQNGKWRNDPYSFSRAYSLLSTYEKYTSGLIIRPKANIGNTVRGKTVLTHSTITPPKVNRRWNLEQCEPNVGGWPWQILGAIRAVATVSEAAEIFGRWITTISPISNFTVGRVKSDELRHCAKFRRNRSNRSRYNVSFNIMLVWLENAYSRPFLGVLGVHSSKWCHSSS